MGSTDPTRSAARPVYPGTRTIPEETLLGRYRVLARRGAGGFGTVCTCWDTRLQRRVAIKRMPLLAAEDPSGISASTADEALAEARTACLLAHPNIVTVYDFEADGTYAYLVMEYVDGLNLAELLARVEGGVLTHEECAHVLRSVAAALTYAHENGVLHLDIKPTNIMIDRQGTVKLADFGMATLASAAGYGGARGGTVGYMPPEQIQGLLVDERTDVFALAVVTWQALAGRSPFASATPKGSLDAIVRGPKPPLSKLDPSLAPEAETALLRAMTPTAAERASSVKGFARDVLPALGDDAEGAESLRELVDQSESDDPSLAAGPPNLPAHVRLPWLAPALERAASAACTFMAVFATLSGIPGTTGAFALVGALVSAAACVAWPPIGSAAAGASLVAALATTHATAASFPLALVTAAGLVAWWVSCGHTDHVSTAAVLAPACLSSPAAGVALAGYGMDPLPAAATGGAGALLSLLVGAAAAGGFSAQATVAALLPVLLSPATWVVVAGCAVSALLASAVAMRGSVASGIVGQVAGAVSITLFWLLAGSVESSGYWLGHIWEGCGLAVSLCVFLCVETVLRGPLDEDQEGEDSDELSQ
ncbi:MAG: serine/threonine protein kinase [Coriobacteriaceae bacterium]|uniref:serine/threonine-protein kinase n=1 Tax=Tractidigestivibacter sp. TaxID=2847320 RepID=UPI002A91EECE|nr:serine/threonine-protein kinase [Tractidigestivibacter sp.]MCI7437863.1 serine/threonine protein kinase [Coriobacteriaceae bacterium]MDY5271208.1 serine/threonine-protein kinase [Tractidigestivibacter sp.]